MISRTLANLSLTACAFLCVLTNSATAQWRGGPAKSVPNIHGGGSTSSDDVGMKITIAALILALAFAIIASLFTWADARGKYSWGGRLFVTGLASTAAISLLCWPAITWMAEGGFFSIVAA